MDLVWTMGEATVQAVHAALNRRRGRSVRKETVQVQMSRLERYGWLARRRESKVFVYRPLREREETTREILRYVRERIFGGSQADLFRCLIKEDEVSEAELKRIQALLRSLENESRND